MKRIRVQKPGRKPTQDERIAFMNDTIAVTILGAMMHNHVHGDLPYPCGDKKQLIDSFHQLAKELTPGKGPADAAEYLSKAYMSRVIEGKMKGLTVPIDITRSWFNFLDGGHIESLPCTGKIPYITPQGITTFHLELDKTGHGEIFRWRDPESDSTRIGRETLLKITSAEDFLRGR